MFSIEKGIFVMRRKINNKSFVKYNPFNGGIISVITLDPSKIINKRRQNRLSDRVSIMGDFLSVGDDMRKALRKFEDEMKDSVHTVESK